VTWRDNRDRIPTIRGSNSAHRRGTPNLFGNLPVGSGLAEGNGQQRCPHLLLESRAFEGKGKVERPASAGEILAELTFRFEKNRVVVVLDSDGRRHTTLEIVFP
jgi:hypothetical protein